MKIRKWSFPCFALLFLFTHLFHSSSSTSHISGGRNLLQARKDCPVSFEFLNYTIITSQCKSPEYPKDRCCAALKEIACPYAEQINDDTTNCADAFYSYLLINGKYPNSFNALCEEGKDGIPCPETPPPPPSISANSSSCARSTHVLSTLFSLLINLCLLLVCLPGNG
ncbi:hypothetical protein SLE2022_219650 [Rubroshorea leprosula]